MSNRVLPFDNSFVLLPERCFARQQPESASSPELICVNGSLATSLGLDAQWLSSAEGIAMMAGNWVPQGADPVAAAYAGHQFGGWNPQLGDGRALLLGELIGADGKRYDLQLKGAGRTPFSRGGDGRSPLGPVLREYLVSEAMAALGIATTRALGAVTTGDWVMRQTALPGAVLTRVAQSHLRIGTCQYFAARQDREALKLLVDYVWHRHYAEQLEVANSALALLDRVVLRQAQLVASWQLVGFIHGVMNTDNMLLSGETIDYGPCAFMDAYDPDTVYSSIDQAGRYAYRNQPAIARWNLVRLAESLLPLVDDDQAVAVAQVEEVLNSFGERYREAYQHGMAAKLGFTEWRQGDEDLLEQMLATMAAERLDYTLTFRRLADLADPEGDAEFADVADIAPWPAALQPWLSLWHVRLRDDPMRPSERRAAMCRTNPAFIARNHRVEEVIVAAVDEHDLSPFHRLLKCLVRPYAYDPAQSRFALPPRADEVVQQTFCGT